MNGYYDKLMHCVDQIKKRVDFEPETAVVLGSGLGDFAKEVEVEYTVPYSEIDGFKVSTVSGHEGQFLFGRCGGKKVILMQGRVHYYEGYEMHDVVMPIRVMRLLGAKNLILTNAAGGANSEFSPGNLMMISDHIAQFVPSPLRGENMDELGDRFPDMSSIYDPEITEKAIKLAQDMKIGVKRGIYLQASGPNYESPAEVRMFKSLGADAVGMSTACEAIAARHMGMRVCGISCITNMAAGISKSPLSHDEVKEIAAQVSGDFKALVTEIISTLL